MRIGVADYGINVWEGGCFDFEHRLHRLEEIGYEGLERVEATDPAEALLRAARFRRLDMDFATCRGPSPQESLRWTAGLGKHYVWVSVSGTEFDVFCRQASHQAELCRRWGVRVGLHNHLGTPVESQEELEEFLERCPQVGLILDTAHLAAADGDPVRVAEEYNDRLVAVHLKDWIVQDPEIGLDNWTQRGRFCELGAGNIDLDNLAVMEVLREKGYDGWVFVEQDTHVEGPYEELAISREYLRRGNF